MRANSDITGLILAGGKSSRLDYRPKGLIKWKGQTLVRHIASALKPVVSGIVVSANHPAYKDQGFEVWADKTASCGPMSGLLTGLKKASTKYVLIVACDMPFINSAFLSYLTCFKEKAKAIIPNNHGKAEPLCAVYSKAIIPMLQQEFREERYKMISALAEMSPFYLRVSHETPGFRTDLFTNINESEQLEYLK